jgi:PDZ domain/Aspartyl protease
MRNTEAATWTMLAVSLTQTISVAAAVAPGEILDAYKVAAGGNAWDDKVTLETQFTTAGYGLTGTGHSIGDLRTGRFVSEYTLGPTSTEEGFDGANRWQREMSGTVTLQQGGDGRELAANDSYRTGEKWWQPDRGDAQISDGGEKSCGDATCEVLSITPKNGKAFEAWFDRTTGLLVKTVEHRQPLTVMTTMSDYRRVDGIMLPFRITVDTGLGKEYLRTLSLTEARFAGPRPESVYTAPKVTLTDFSIAGGAPETAIPFHLINNHIYGAARVNKRGPYVFLFDTGGTNDITPTLARTVGLEIVGRTPEFGAGAGIMEGGFTRVLELQVGDAVLRNQVFSVTPLEDQEPIEGTPMAGLVGYEVFSRFVTRIDYGAGMITLMDTRNFDPQDAGTPVKFVFHAHIPEVTGTFEGLPARYSIDTGARFELMLTKSYAAQTDLRAKHPKGIDSVYGWGVGGAARGYVTRASEISLGDVTVNDVVTDLSLQDRGGLSGSIGGGILKRFVVTFDYAHQTIYLKPRPRPIADIGTFDRAGMWFNTSSQGFEIVDVVKGAPAEQAGLHVGDTILAVDGEAVAKLHLYDLRQRLRDDPPETVVTFRVKAGPAVKDVRVTLRNLI